MVFNSFKNGFENEKEFVESIHNKKFNELNFNLQLFIEDLFGHIENEKIIKCYQNEEKKKFDICIKIDGKEKLVSIKKGIKNSIHFSSLTYQPLDRCLNNNPLYERRRFIIQIKWYNLCDDIIECMNDNVSNAV